MPKSTLVQEVQNLQNKIRKEIDFHREQISILEGLLAGGVSEVGNGRRGRPKQMASVIRATTKAGKKKGRVRRDPDKIQQDAKEVISIIRAGGKEGVRAKDFGHVKINGSPKDFLKQYAPDFKWKTTGKKASTRYFAA